jgi:phosphoribosylaminoimidazole-succinocarboxamide synthase
MVVLYEGKTKNVVDLGNGRKGLCFKDDATGVNGVFDPGANQVGVTIDGFGNISLRVSTMIFKHLEYNAFHTHFISSDEETNIMEIRNAEPFGLGLEIICRLRAIGSFIKRYGAYVKEGDELDYFVEFTLKDDARGDPFITKECLILLGVLTAKQYDRLTSMTALITNCISDFLLSKGIELWDIKLEFGQDGISIILIDEISAGNMRCYKNGKLLEPMELSKLILS